MAPHKIQGKGGRSPTAAAPSGLTNNIDPRITVALKVAFKAPATQAAQPRYHHFDDMR